MKRRCRGILFVFVETEFGVGLLAAAGGFVEIGTVDFGDYGIVVAVAVAMGGGGEGEGVQFGLSEETEVDEWERLDGVGGGFRRRHEHCRLQITNESELEGIDVNLLVVSIFNSPCRFSLFFLYKRFLD